MDAMVKEILEEARELTGSPYLHFSVTDLAEKHNLNEPRFADIAQKIGQLVYATQPDVRSDAVGALCTYRPVAGYEWVAWVGWDNAGPVGIHEYASALISVVGHADELELNMVHRVVRRIFPGDDEKRVMEAGCEPYEIELVWTDVRNAVFQVIAHFHSLLFPGHPDSGSIWSETRFRERMKILGGIPQEGVATGWRMVARLWHVFTEPRNNTRSDDRH